MTFNVMTRSIVQPQSVAPGNPSGNRGQAARRLTTSFTSNELFRVIPAIMKILKYSRRVGRKPGLRELEHFVWDRKAITRQAFRNVAHQVAYYLDAESELRARPRRGRECWDDVKRARRDPAATAKCSSASMKPPFSFFEPLAIQPLAADKCSSMQPPFSFFEPLSAASEKTYIPERRAKEAFNRLGLTRANAAMKREGQSWADDLC